MTFDTRSYVASGLQKMSDLLKATYGGTDDDDDPTRPPTEGLAPVTAPAAPAADVADDGGPLAWGGHQNGRIPRDQLQPLRSQPNHRLEAAAADAYDRMVAAAAADGVTITITDSYRTYDQQVDLKERKPTLAARAGTSNHGWGRAIDVTSAAARRWVQANGERFGWVWPAWARPGGSKPEDWHFEFRP